MDDIFPFPGFEEPRSNYFRIPNNWLEALHPLIERYSNRCIAPLKILQYLMCHTWHQPYSLSFNEIQNGRCKHRHRSRRLDSGTGLAENSIRKALIVLCELGYVETENLNGKAPLYRVKTQESDLPQEKISSSEAFSGFDAPTANYFKIPNAWTEICATISSSTTILCITYAIRHAWGFHNDSGVWMTVDEFANGRRKNDHGDRYDNGLSYDRSSIYRALDDAVGRGLMVWADDGVEKYFNLRLTGMAVSLSGQFMGPLPWDDDQDNFEPSVRKVEGGIRKVAGGANCNDEGSTGNVAPHSCNVEVSVSDVDAPSCNNEGKNSLIKTNINTFEDTPQTPSTTTSPCPTLVTVVAENYNNTSAMLGAIGINTKKAKNVVTDGKYSLAEIIAWIVFAWNQKGITNPEAYIFARCRDGDRPSNEYLNLVTQPINDLVYEFPEMNLPPTIANIVELHLNSNRKVEDVQLNQPTLSECNPEYAEKLWNRVKSELRQSIRQTDFSTWVEPTRGLSWDKNTLIVASINSIGMAWIQKHLGSSITSVLEVAHPDSQVEFVVAPPA